MMKDLKEEFYKHVSPLGDDECWIWGGYIGVHGYGVITIDKTQYRAHRLSYLVNKEPIAEGLCVCHACDVKSCTNPNHLWLGTHQDNIADKSRKGRCAKGETHGSKTKPHRVARGSRNGMHTKPEMRPKGEKNGFSKLSDAKVREILKFRGRATQKEIADVFGITQSNVSLILRGKRWAHVN